MRTARNLWEAGVPYYNVDDPVAANTSLFWMYPLAWVHAIFSNPAQAVGVVFVLSTAAFAGMAVLVGMYSKSLTGKAAVVLFVALTAPALFYGGTGWEHVPQAILTTAGFLFILDHQKLPNWLLCFYTVSLSFLLRPDSASIVVSIYLLAILSLGGAGRLMFFTWSLPAVIIPILYSIQMQYWYGDFFPNTYYLKMNPHLWQSISQGAAYVVNPISSGPVPIIGAALGLLWRSLSRGERIILISLAVHTLYIIYIGGDYFGHGRFYLVFFPIITLILVRQLERFQRVQVALGLSLGMVLLSLLEVQSSTVQRSHVAIRSQIKLAEVIEQRLHPDDGPIGLHFLGIGYHLRRFHIVDFLGKADREVAQLRPKNVVIGHNKWDSHFSLEIRRPIAIMIPDDLYQATIQAPGINYESGPFADFWKGLIATALATGRFHYRSAEQLCVDGTFGLLLDVSVLALFDRARCS